jgi:polar amino acid transport system permease protein
MDRVITNVMNYIPILASGLQMTLLITFGSLILSTVLGLGWAILRMSSSKALSVPSALIVNVLRGIPMIVQLYYIYFVMPELGITLTAPQAGIIGIGIAYSVYQAEDFRAGIEAVDKGQTEAAESLGMSRALMMRRVIIPQAIRIILPSYGNTMVMMLKDSSLASTITVTELSLRGKILAASTFENTTIFTLVAIMYLTMCLPLMMLSRWFERRFNPNFGAKR